MNKKLISLAVAAALVAPAAAMADAVLYGKLNVSLDYESIDNFIQPLYNNSATAATPANPAIGALATPANPGVTYFVNATGNRLAATVPYGVVLTPAQQEIVRVAAMQGYTPLNPGQMYGGQNADAWGMSRNPGFQGEGRASRLGVKGSEDLGGGLKAIYQIELGINANDTTSNIVDNADAITYRNTFIGLAGGFGTALMGRHDTPLKISTSKLDLFADTMADYNGTIGFNDLRADNAVAYISPSFSGFTLAAAIVPGGMGTAGAGQNIDSSSIAEGYSIAGIYSNGPFYGSLAYEAIGTQVLESTGTSLNGCGSTPVWGPDAALTSIVQIGTQGTCSQASDDFTKWRLGLGLLDWNGFTLTGIYEEQKGLPGANTVNTLNFTDPRWSQFSYTTQSGADERDLWQIQAGYRFGNVQLKGMYGQTSFKGTLNSPNLTALGVTPENAAIYANNANSSFNGDTESWAIGVDYNFSKRTSVYALYTANTSDSSSNMAFTNGVGAAPMTTSTAVGLQSGRTLQWDGFSLGMMHSF